MVCLFPSRLNTSTAMTWSSTMSCTTFTKRRMEAGPTRRSRLTPRPRPKAWSSRLQALEAFESASLKIVKNVEQTMCCSTRKWVPKKRRISSWKTKSLCCGLFSLSICATKFSTLRGCEKWLYIRLALKRLMICLWRDSQFHTLKEKTMNKVFPGNHVWLFFTSLPNLSLSSKSISIKSNKTIIFSLLYHIFTHVIPSSIHQQLEEKLLKWLLFFPKTWRQGRKNNSPMSEWFSSGTGLCQFATRDSISQGTQ